MSLENPHIENMSLGMILGGLAPGFARKAGEHAQTSLGGAAARASVLVPISEGCDGADFDGRALVGVYGCCRDSMRQFQRGEVVGCTV